MHLCIYRMTDKTQLNLSNVCNLSYSYIEYNVMECIEYWDLMFCKCGGNNCEWFKKLADEQ